VQPIVALARCALKAFRTRRFEHTKTENLVDKLVKGSIEWKYQQITKSYQNISQKVEDPEFGCVPVFVLVLII